MTNHIQTVTFANPAYTATIGRVTEKTKPFPNGDTRESVAVELDLAALPVESIDFALRYGLGQYIADGAAGAEDLAGYKLGIANRIQKLKDADFARTRGEGAAKPDSEESRARKLVTAFLREKAKAANVTPDRTALAEAAGKLVAADPKWRKMAAKQLKDEAALRSEEASPEADDVMAAIMAGLAGNGGEQEGDATDEG